MKGNKELKKLLMRMGDYGPRGNTALAVEDHGRRKTVIDGETKDVDTVVVKGNYARGRRGRWKMFRQEFHIMGGGIHVAAPRTGRNSVVSVMDYNEDDLVMVRDLGVLKRILKSLGGSGAWRYVVNPDFFKPNPDNVKKSKEEIENIMAVMLNKAGIDRNWYLRERPVKGSDNTYNGDCKHQKPKVKKRVGRPKGSGKNRGNRRRSASRR